MAEGIESFSETRNWNRVKAGFKGGDFFANPMVPQKMTFVEGVPKEVIQAEQSGPVPSMPIRDAWYDRRK